MTENKFKVLRLWNPLFPSIYYKLEDGSIDDYPCKYHSDDLADYQQEIQTHIDNQFSEGEREKGLAAFFYKEPVQDKIVSIKPSVELYAGQVWGVTEIRFRESLSESEQEALVEFLTGQYFDGWGEVLEQHPIEIEEGELHISFCGDGQQFYLKEETEMLIALAQHPRMCM